MASNILAGDQLNFTRMGIASVDEIKVVLADILRCEIKPQDLPKSISSCSELTSGRHKLRPDQQKLCCPSPPGVPDYNKFDVSLLYTLIRNLCPQFKPTQGWGKTPSTKDLQVGDDIERLRVFRNEMFAHLESSCVEDIVFTSQWQNLEQIFQRMQTFLNQKGLSVNYKKNLKSIAKADFGLTDMEKYKLLLEGTMYMLKKHPINDDPSISIRGKAEVLCGENTFFEAELDNCPPSSNWPITWEKFQGNVTEQLDISKEKYRGSSSRFLVLPRVLMEDKGEYRAVISRKHVKVQSNAILLTVRGELPRLQKLKVTSERDDINILYKYEISQDIPKVHHIAWTKNDKVLKIDNMKYIGGDLKDNLLKITSPSVEDRGRYTCTITNAVGSVSESLILDPPNISNDHLTRINSRSVILTCEIFPYDQSPPLTKLQWQKDGQVIDIPGSGGKYTGGTLDEPSLTITNVNQSDAGTYQCKASNAVGSTFGEAIFLGFPVFQVLGPENTESGICVFTMNSSSCPAVFSVQWSKKNKDNDEYTPIDVNDKEYLGTSNSLPNPKLVIKQAPLHKHSFKVEAQNFIGTSTKTIPDDSSFPTASKVDNKANRVAAIFKNKGTSFKFDKLRLKLIEEIPDTKLDSLKESIKVITQKDLSVENVTTVEGFFTLILNEGIFSQQNVILMQYLLKSIGRPDLEQKCVEYARKTKASCFFKEPEHPDIFGK
ncbi:titin-like [Saccostrea cucullata]|uniref:titin-like n=1 Tax=Saccostrea cuccullata TaxID=36930 RepID=UPI002ED6156C